VLSLSPASSDLLFPPVLAWSHYLVLLRVAKPEARSFYEIEAAREGWSVRQLERQIASLLFERLPMNKNQDEILALARRGQEVAVPADVIKDPFVLEFLDLREKPTALERDLERAIIDRLEELLLEIGKGFCFVARQKRLTLDGDHFYVDLVFYNRLLRAFVLVDLTQARKPPFDDEPQMFLDPINPQSDVSDVLFDMFEKRIATDRGYHDRLVRHYEMWKQVVDDPAHPDHAKVRSEGHDDPSFRPAVPREEPFRRAQPKVGPNEPCPCGSGRKYKRCCRP
jgi:predicted nuclease of restriction endonuclease-like (RecB) superfamily